MARFPEHEDYAGKNEAQQFPMKVLRHRGNKALSSYVNKNAQKQSFQLIECPI